MTPVDTAATASLASHRSSGRRMASSFGWSSGYQPRNRYRADASLSGPSSNARMATAAQQHQA